MIIEDIKKLSDDDLVKFVGNVPHASFIQHAQAELMRRNTFQIKKFNESSAKINRAMILFTASLFFIGIMQIIITILTSGLSVEGKGILIPSAIGCLLFLFWKLEKAVDGNR